ncbi:relaxase [Citrobacter freundii complex sp. CFNIH2]|uniref:conjugal transfer nickase/helicase domain-containing protein n=1 Tax=Citrobacter freundii complex sp. CFNIH2 TaxID=2066049 RepID=UPI000C868C4B|nr:TraI domain-containing protein [Citrobacter freundii complex sp. CFNIH2]AUO65975.1 relaxase [Citrobacter freundii complex sp. CFNIH2]
MLSRIRTLRSLFSKGEPEAVHPISTVTPVGYHAPREASRLCASPLRETCLQQLWENCSLPADIYQQLYLAPLNGLLARVQNVPAAQKGRWSQSDGFGDLTLQFTTCAVRLAKGYMFPPGAAPEEQAAQNVMWNAVIYWSALFWHLPLLATLEGELLDGKSWLPGMTVPDSPYRFRFREAENASAFAALAAGQLMPAEATGWLAENPGALGNLAGALWNQHPGMPLIRSLMKQAAEKTDSPLIESETDEVVNTLAGGLYGDKTTVQTIHTSILSPDVSSQQSDTNTADALAAPAIFDLASSIEPASQTDSLLSDDLSDSGSESPANETVMTAVADDTDVLLSLFEVPEKMATDGDSSEALPEEPFSENEKNSPSYPTENTEFSESPDSHSTEENSEHSAVAFVNKCDERLHSASGAVSGTEEVEGTRFFDWLREGINRGEIAFNGKDDKVHIIAGYVFLPVPGIFFDYLKATGSTDNREKVQSSFEQLNLHKRRDNRRFYFAQLFDTPDKSGKFKRMKGYLVKSRQVFRKTIPQDSQFLLFP